jgi:CRP-like cAMP-binding protein
MTNRLMKVERLRCEEVVCREGSVADSFCFIISGTLALLKRRPTTVSLIILPDYQ